jgi:hypothetical protein
VEAAEQSSCDASTPAREIAANRSTSAEVNASLVTPGDDLVEQPAPFLQRRGQVASHLAVEVPLPGPGGLVQLHGAGGTPVIRADLHRGPPHLHLPEDVSGDRAPALGCPFGSVGVGDTGSNLVGQCGDQIGSGGQATSA